MFLKASTLFLLARILTAAPLSPEERQSSCPQIHIFRARETTAPSGYSSAGTVVDLILNPHPSSTAEVINYLVAGGNTYGSSVQAGMQAIMKQVNAFYAKCANTELVMVGYSQIMVDAFCGGGDPNQGIIYTYTPINRKTAGAKVKTIIWMGDPRRTPGAPYNVGTSNAPGFDPYPTSQTCTVYSSRVQSYCGASDPYCSNGNNPATYQGYGQGYGQRALAFVNSKL